MVENLPCLLKVPRLQLGPRVEVLGSRWSFFLALELARMQAPFEATTCAVRAMLRSAIHELAPSGPEVKAASAAGGGLTQEMLETVVQLTQAWASTVEGKEQEKRLYCHRP